MSAARWLVARRARGRRRALALQLPDVARALARGLAAGLPLLEACRRGAAALSEPAADALLQAAAGLEAGRRPDGAFAELREVPGGGMIAGAVALHDELGGDLARGLHALADGLADAARLDAELRAATAQARLAARLVPIVPLAAAGMLALASPDSVGPLVSTPAGIAILAACGSLTAVGMLLVRRIMAAAAA